MKLFCISQKNKNVIIEGLLRKAAESRKIDFIEIDQNKFNFVNFNEARDGDLLYRSMVTYRARNIEIFLLYKEIFTTFYRNNKDGINRPDNVFDATMLFKYKNLPIIPTVFDITSNRELLLDYVNYLGGFPVVIKVIGGSHGIGVVRIDSIESLNSYADVADRDEHTYIMRQYIHNHQHARLIVIGEKVVASIEYKKDNDDFRTGDTRVFTKRFSDEVNEIAIKAVSVLNLEFGGVDILISEDGIPYIAEVNFPCYFPRAQETTGINIAGLMVDYLVAKSRKKDNK